MKGFDSAFNAAEDLDVIEGRLPARILLTHHHQGRLDDTGKMRSLFVFSVYCRRLSIMFDGLMHYPVSELLQ
jgi:hypothetical protein